MDEALARAGINDAGANLDCVKTTDAGARAEDWLTTGFHQNVLKSLPNQSIKVVYISLGGNDMINVWNKNMTPQQEIYFFEKVKADLEKIILTYQAIRPDVKFLVSGYDFPRFTPNHPISAYKKAFEEMGSPEPYVINNALVRFSEKIAEISDLPQTSYVHHLGLMHYHFGNQSEGLKPRTTKRPAEISRPGDKLNTHGGVTAMMTDISGMQVFIKEVMVVDAFHLSKKGFGYLADHSVEQQLKEWLR